MNTSEIPFVFKVSSAAGGLPEKAFVLPPSSVPSPAVLLLVLSRRGGAARRRAAPADFLHPPIDLSYRTSAVSIPAGAGGSEVDSYLANSLSRWKH